ncbi:hypothetical protein [Candidatus Spongiihabitans sp.]|uniref:hypothetical protein n=1 Tax=Candidatus Spongiihabitans sp. TaxID=3101308 RepID=UPI003C7D191E
MRRQKQPRIRSHAARDNYPLDCPAHIIIGRAMTDWEAMVNRARMIFFWGIIYMFNHW